MKIKQTTKKEQVQDIQKCMLCTLSVDEIHKCQIQMINDSRVCIPFSGDRGGSFAPRGSYNDHRGAAVSLRPEPKRCQACSCHQVTFYFDFLYNAKVF